MELNGIFLCKECDDKVNLHLIYHVNFVGYFVKFRP